MPLYEYQCSKCGKVFEKMQKFSDAPLTECECPDQGPVERLISAPGRQFKGSGWYITDYARSGGGANGKSEGAKSEGAKSEGAKTESKSESKSDSKPSTSTSTSKTE
jgi:putative FmdB family regulatory protein